MNIVLWIVQILLALAFAMAGVMKTTQPIEKLATNMGWVKDFTAQIVRLIGTLELLAAVGLILPAVTGILPWLTPVAAIGLVLTMVGAFYNTFMPGSTGGDVLKAYYASKHTTHRTRAVLSVIIDRVIGLLALIIMGGVMASIQYWRSPLPDDPVTRACRRVAIGSALILLAVIGGMLIFFTPALRRLLGVDYLLARLPMWGDVL